jgi:general secretion pathway protein C
VVKDSLDDFDRLFQQVEIKPVQTYGHPSGLRVVSIEAGSIFDELGLQSTDVIVGINGASITTPDQADLLFQSINAGGYVTIQVKGKRRNRIIHLDIS